MNGAKGVAVCAGTLFVAAVLQQSLAYRLTVLGGAPDFMLIALAVLGMFASRPGGMVLGFADGLVAGALWPIVMAVPAALVTRRLVINKEERYLEARFGAQYTDYKKRVRRWL